MTYPVDNSVNNNFYDNYEIINDKNDKDDKQIKDDFNDIQNLYDNLKTIKEDNKLLPTLENYDKIAQLSDEIVNKVHLLLDQAHTAIMAMKPDEDPTELMKMSDKLSEILKDVNSDIQNYLDPLPSDEQSSSGKSEINRGRTSDESLPRPFGM